MATKRKPAAPVTNPRDSRYQAGKASTPVQTVATVGQLSGTTLANQNALAQTAERSVGYRPSAGLGMTSGVELTTTGSPEQQAGIFGQPTTPDTSQSARLAQLENATVLPNTQVDGRAPAGAPLKSASSGAGGRVGQLGVNPAKDKARQAELNAVKGQRPVTYTDSEGNVRTNYVEDPVETERLRQELKMRYAQEDANNQAAQMNQQGQIQQQNASMGSPFDSFREQIANDPSMAQFMPLVDQMESQYQNTTGNAQGMFNQTMGQMNMEDQDGDGVSDGVEESIASSKELITDDKAKADAINQENKQIALDAAKLQKENAEIEKAKFELSQARNENLLREQNIEAEIKNRRVANKLGIEDDTNGLKWMQEEIRKGTEALAFLSQAGDLQSAQFALQIGDKYNLDVRSALNEHSSIQFQLQSQYASEISALDNVAAMDAKERQKEKKEWAKWLFEQKAEADKTAAGQLERLTMTMQESIVTRAKQDVELKNTLWDRLFKQRAQDGNLNPGSTMTILKQMQEAGIDVSSIDPNAMTESQVNELHRTYAAEQKAKRDLSGRPMTAGQVNEISEYENSLKLLDSVKQRMLVDYKNVGGPLAGRLGTLPGTDLFSESAAIQREFQAQVDLVKQIIGKALEGGVLRKEDEIKYEKILPNIKDTDRSRAFKISELERQIEAKRSGLLQNLSFGGYNTSGFDGGDPIQSREEPVLNDDEAQRILERIESGEPLTFGGDTAGSALAVLGSRETQGFETELDPNLYSDATIKAWGGKHLGLDIAMSPGTALPSVVPGKVLTAGYESGWGNTVVVEAEDGSLHRYSHLNDFNVKKGDTVRPGQVIAFSGGAKGAKGAGTSTGPHLDYRVKVDGSYIDPYSYSLNA